MISDGNEDMCARCEEECALKDSHATYGEAEAPEAGEDANKKKAIELLEDSSTSILIALDKDEKTTGIFINGHKMMLQALALKLTKHLGETIFKEE